MIHLKDTLCAQILRVINESHDCADILNDLTRIERLLSCPFSLAWQIEARRLDQELRSKYPVTDMLLNAANSVPTLNSNSTPQETPVEVTVLRQDYFGIICHAGLKKDILHSIPEFIDRVD